MKILVILGSTASGKSDLAVRLAKKFNGEIISADSRQVYKGLDIGTGKITKEEMDGVPHYLLDVIEPGERFSVSAWKKAAENAVHEIQKKSKLPIICGGTGYYIQALLNDSEFPEIQSDPKKQTLLEEKNAQELFEELKNLDPERAQSMSLNGESSNKRRLVRAILIAGELGKVPPITTATCAKYHALKIGIKIPDAELKERIKNRLIKRLDAGMIEEAQNLHQNGLSYERMRELGLEYRYLADYLENKISKEELTMILSTKIWQYARRQKTWFKRDKEIEWFDQSQFDKVDSRVAAFLQ